MKRISLVCFIALLAACSGGKQQVKDDYAIKATGVVKSFEIDSDVKYNAFYLYIFCDKSGK